MAPKKKTDVKKAKDVVNDAAQALDRIAARNEAFLKRRNDDVFGKDTAWAQAQKDVDDLDRSFGEEEVVQKESFMDFLRSKLRSGETEVRVMQIGPDGRLIDVSDKVKAQDLKPEHIERIQTEDGKTLPLGRNPQSREAAMRLLQEILPDLRPASGSSSTSESIRRMKLILDESDKILEHWKK